MNSTNTPRWEPQWGTYLPFTLWSLAILALAPYANDLQAWLAERAGTGIFQGLTAGSVGVAAALVLAVRWRQGRPLGWAQLLWLGGLGVLGIGSLRLLTGQAEPLHLLEYGGLGLLAYRALRPRFADTGLYLVAGALCTIVGTVDEVVQWVTPERYWSLEDVALNAFAAGLVLAGIAKGWRPEGVEGWPGARSLRLANRLLLVEVALLGLCLANTPARTAWLGERLPVLGELGIHQSTRMAEYGHRYEDREIGVFASRLTLAELERIDSERGAEAGAVVDAFRNRYPVFVRQFPPHADAFVFELRQHLLHRDTELRRMRRAEAGSAEARRQATFALREQRILEKYFPRGLAASGMELGAETRQTLEALHDPGLEFESRVGDTLIAWGSERSVLAGLLVVAAALVLVERRLSKGLREEG